MGSFAQDFVSRLDGVLDNDQLRAVLNELEIFSSEYDITPKCTELTEEHDPIPTYLKMYMVSKKIEGLSMRTLELYQSVLGHFFQTVDKPVDAVTTNDVRIYLYKYQQDSGISNRTLESKRVIINSFFKWCVDEEYIDTNPCAQVRNIKYEEKPREPLSDVELEMVRDACTSYRDKAIIETFYSTGCRVSELVGLKRSDLDFQTKEVKLFGKGAKHRVSWMNARMEVAIKKYLFSRTDGNDYVFVSEREPHEPLGVSRVQDIIKEIGNESGIGRPLYPHLIRHTTATNALTRGMSVTELQAMLGHSKTETTMIYAKINQNDVHHDHTKCII